MITNANVLWASVVSRRGFCVFPNQASLSIEDQKLLCRKLGQLTTRPSTSGVYIHPVNQTTLPDGTVDPELMAPARDPKKKLYTREGGFSKGSEARQSRADGWHTDGTYEQYVLERVDLFSNLVSPESYAKARTRMLRNLPPLFFLSSSRKAADADCGIACQQIIHCCT